MDWHIVVAIIGIAASVFVSVIGYAGTTFIFVYRMGGFTSRLEALLQGLKEEIAPMKKHEAQIARLDERVSHLESKRKK